MGRIWCAVALIPWLALGGCKSDSPAASSSASAPAPITYAGIAERFNQRVDKLGRIWSRAVVSIDFTDDEGRRRYEQGEGFFQVVRPSSLALSVGKAGETFVWMGCDAERYWVIEPRREKRASIGRHEALTPAKLKALLLPCAPLDLISLAGLRPLPVGDFRRGERPSEPIEALDRGDTFWQFDVPREGQTFRYLVEPKTLRPRVVSIVDRATGKLTTTARLDNYLGVEIQGMGGSYPVMPALVRVEHIPTGSVIKMTLDGMNDGLVNDGRRKGRLAPENFDFNALCDAFGVTEIFDLDSAGSVGR